MSESWVTASKEPSLDELFEEPIVQMLMRRDGVRIQELQSNLHRGTVGSGKQPRRFV